jgi:hypothetical protein
MIYNIITDPTSQSTFDSYMIDIIINLGNKLSILKNPKLEGIYLDVITKKISNAYKTYEQRHIQQE